MDETTRAQVAGLAAGGRVEHGAVEHGLADLRRIRLELRQISEPQRPHPLQVRAPERWVKHAVGEDVQHRGEVVVIETPYDEDIIILQREINGTVIPYGPGSLQKRTEEKTKQLSQVAAAAPAQAAEMASYLNKRAKVNSEAVTGDGDLVADLKAGRTSFSALKDDDLPANIRAMKPAEREAEVNKQMGQRKALNEKLAAIDAKRDKYIAEQRAKAPPNASSFDRVVEETLRAQIKR